jgi:abortive infection bacteriophage resistance protein
LVHQTKTNKVMEEIIYVKARRGNDIVIINKEAKYELGVIHICGNHYLLDDDTKYYSHLNNAIESLINQKCNALC